MILLVDIGNSNIVFACAENGKIVDTYRLKSFLDKTDDEYYFLLHPILKNFELKDVIISSVVPIITSALKNVFRKHYNITPMILGPGVKLVFN